MELFWWLLTVILFAIGLIGTVLPVFPGTIIILAGALLHRLMLGPEKGIGWRTIAILVLLTLATYALDFLSGLRVPSFPQGICQRPLVFG